MRVAIIGSTGFVGTAIFNELAERNHSIKGISRQQKLQLHHPNTVGVSVDVTNEDALAVELQGADVVISAFNPGWTNPSIYEDYLKGSKHILEACRKADVKRLIVIGGAGSLYLDENTRVIDSPSFPKEVKEGAQAALDFYELIKNDKQIDWVFFSPAIEMHPGTSGTRTGKYRLGIDYPVINNEGRSVLSVEDLAVVIADEVENQTFTRRRFTAGY